jgi:hypothetical protein
MIVDRSSDPRSSAPANDAMRRLTLAALLLLPLAAACERNSTLADDRNGRLTGTLNGAPWNGDARSGTYRDTLYISSGQQASGSSTERRIVVAVVPNGQGGYSVVPAANPYSGSGYQEIVGGDVVSYSAPVTAGTVAFTEYTATRTRGSLQLTFSGSRGVWQFSGQFDAPREDIN